MNDKAFRTHPLKLALYMILMGILTGWIFALAIPVAMEEELSASTVNMLPVYGFVAGAMLGLGMYFVGSLREIVFVLLMSMVLGAVLWFLAVLLVRAVLLLVEVPEDNVDAISEWVGPIAFAIGPILGLVAAFAIGHDKFHALHARLRPNQGKLPRRR